MISHQAIGVTNPSIAFDHLSQDVEECGDAVRCLGELRSLCVVKKIVLRASLYPESDNELRSNSQETQCN